uniref:Immunoglobulin domain-containing protein n=1 Tax=Gopherus evgoodei TaxID=1825980 RepID=A0A8C4W776_9SAUR
RTPLYQVLHKHRVKKQSLPLKLTKESESVFTAPGADVTIWCQGQRQDVRFFLHKTGDLNPQQHMDPAGAGAEFRIPTVGRQHGGNYSCSYRPRSEPFVSSQPSDPVQLVIGSYPKPSISVSPSGLIPVGGKVTIQCWHQRLGMRFLFYKAGDGNYLTYTDPAGSKAEFPIISARRDHGGSYTCRYHDKSGIYSEPSDPVQIIVLSSPKPSSSLSPSRGVVLEVAMTVRCQGQRRGLEFALYKAGARNAAAWGGDLAGVEFPIPKVSRAEGGSYTCYYFPSSDPDTWSEPSNPVQLVVAGEGPSSASPLPAPTPPPASPTGRLHANVTIRCQGQHQDMGFFLHKAGDLNPQRHMDPAGAGAEFCIPTVGRQHGGSYSCSYRPRSEPFVSSLPSDPMQLVVAEPPPPCPPPVPPQSRCGPYGESGVPTEPVIRGTPWVQLCPPHVTAGRGCCGGESRGH